MKTSIIAGQPSWQFASDKVTAAVTEQGGHLAPVRFRVGRHVVEPFSIAPWAEEQVDPGTPPMLRVLRGDFFCAPFGGNETSCQGENHPPHGESANSKWQFQSLQHEKTWTRLGLSLQTKTRSGRIDKTLLLRKGQTVVYCRHVISGMNGRMGFGHHAMLKFPDKQASGRISTSPIHFAQVAPTTFEDPAKGGYQSLKPGAIFSRLDRIPSLFGGTADASCYPARRGFEDLFMVVHSAKEDLAWTAVAFPEERYVWFSLKDPRVLQSTVFWLSNGGRHYAPWNGRHVNVMGVEDVTACFHYGLAESARSNTVTRKGFLTSINLRKNAPLAVNYIMGVAAIPGGFDRVKSIRPEKGGISLISSSGQVVKTPVDIDFLNTTSDETQRN